MPRIAGHPFTRLRNLDVDGVGTFPGLIALARGSVDPSLGANDGDFLYNLNGNLIYEAAGVTTTLGAVGGVGTTWESLYANDAAWALTGAFTITQSSNNAFTLTKSATGAGDVFTINNAGTGDDLAIVTTRAAATGIVLDFHHNSGTPADADVILEIQVNGEDDGSTKTEYGRIRFLSDDVTNATEDATFQLALFVAGTQSTCLAITGPVVTIGDGTSNAILESSGALDLILRTNAGTDSGTIRIYDAANGNIEVLPNGTGDLTVPTSGIVLGGTTPTRCSFAVAGTAGDGFLITTSTITTGDVLAVDHTANATLAGGNLLNLLVDSSSVFSVGESGNTTIAGNASGTDALTLTAGDILLTSGHFDMTVGDVTLADGSVSITDADNASSLVVINDTVTSADLVDINSGSLTTGSLVHLTADTAVPITTGRILEMTADTATTAAGLVELTADALSTGIGVLVTSTSLGLAAGQLLNIDHTCSGTITAAKTGQLIDIVSSRTHNAATAISDDYDALSIIRTNVNVDAGGTLNAAGSCLRLENIGTQTAGTLADTVIGLEIVMTGGTTQDGIGISLTHTGTTAGRAMLFTLSHTTLDGAIQVTANSVNTGNVIVADMNGLTEGIGLELTHTTSVITTGSVCRITSTGVDTGTGQGTLLDLVSSAAQAATVVSLVADALTSGIGVFASFDGLTTGEGVSLTHTTSVIADGGSLFRLSSTGIDTGGATNGALVDLSSTAQATGVVARLACNGLTTGTALLVTSSGTITSAGEGLVNIVGTGMTTGFGLKIDLTEGTLTTGLYINCYDDTAAGSVFTVAEDGLTTITGAAGSTMLAITAGDLALSDGAMASAREQVTLGVGATAIAIDSNVVEVTGDGGGNTVTTITGGVAGQLVTLIFVDGNVTINDDDTHGANSIDLVGANTTFADDATLTLVFDGTSYYEVARSIND